MPSGSSGAPATFQRLMQSLFVNTLDEFAIVTQAEYLAVPRQLPECEVATQWVHYLGFVTEPETVSADPEKAERISTWPEELKARRELRGFLALVGYYGN